MTDDSKTRDVALFRYEANSAYLALDPPRGQRGALLKQLAGKTRRAMGARPGSQAGCHSESSDRDEAVRLQEERVTG